MAVLQVTDIADITQKALKKTIPRVWSDIAVLMLQPITRGSAISSQAGLLTQLSTLFPPSQPYANGKWKKLLLHSDEFVRDFHPLPFSPYHFPGKIYDTCDVLLTCFLIILLLTVIVKAYY